MIRVALGIIAVGLSTNCLADLQPQSASQICTVLSDTRLRAGEWTTQKDGHEGCTSGARPINADLLDGNKITFSADGLDGSPHSVRLSLTVVVSSDDYAAKRELIKATKRLSVRTLGLSIPHAFDEAIEKGIPIVLSVGSGHASLTRTAISKQSYLLSVEMK